MKHKAFQEMIDAHIAQHPDADRDSMDDRLMLSIPEPNRHNGFRVRLFGTRGPTATILNGRSGRLSVSVSARRVRDFLNKSTVTG